MNYILTVLTYFYTTIIQPHLNLLKSTESNKKDNEYKIFFFFFHKHFARHNNYIYLYILLYITTKYNVMKKLLSILTLALALSSCIGPMGPQGPQGPKGEPGEGINWKVYDFTIESHQWQLVGDPDQLNSYYMYLFEGNDAKKMASELFERDKKA